MRAEEKMQVVEIRTATLADIPAIVAVETGEEGPWGEPESCRRWTDRRLARGFYIQVAFLDGEPAGHAEWVESDEPNGKTFYLGVLQIKKELQRHGIGRRMMSDGEAEARRRGCARVTLIPELETGADAFYEKLGYRRAREIVYANSKTGIGAPVERIDRIPECVVREERFVLGFHQTASRHMWELIEHPAEGSDAQVARAHVPGGYVALRWFAGKTPHALAWGTFSEEEARAGCAALAHDLGFDAFTLAFDAAARPCLDMDACEIVSSEFEMEKRLLGGAI